MSAKVKINGWDLYPKESQEDLQNAIGALDKAEAFASGEMDIEMSFTPVPDPDAPGGCEKLRWFARMLIKGLKKAGANEAARHFEHWLSGQGDTNAPQLTEEIIKSTACYPELMEYLKGKCCGAEGGRAVSGSKECSEWNKNWNLHMLLGGFLIHYEMSARGENNCCAITINIDDPYDFHFGDKATFKYSTTAQKWGRTINVNFTFIVPDEVLVKLKKCAGPDGLFPTDFARRLTFTDEICCKAGDARSEPTEPRNKKGEEEERKGREGREQEESRRR